VPLMRRTFPLAGVATRQGDNVAGTRSVSRAYRRTVLAFAAVVCIFASGARMGGRDRDISADEALDRLKAGNARFASGVLAGQTVGARRRTELAGGQSPYAIVLSCADSRVPPEIVFNVGLGDIFVVRAAGQVADHSVLASVEYAVEHLRSPLLVVMGHEACGAVKATIETTTSQGPHQDYLINAIRPAVDSTRSAPEKERLTAAIFANVVQVIGDTLARSDVVRHTVESGKLRVVGAYYELVSGRVRFSQAVTVPAVVHKTDR
jgi:carbonic anhydrase